MSLEALLDQQIYAELCSTMGADFVVELIDTYCQETPQLINQLFETLGQSQTDAFRRAAHSIKSSSAAMGAMQLSAQARELEMMAKEGRLDGAAGLLDALQSCYLQTEQALHGAAA